MSPTPRLDVREAIADGLIELHFQPAVRADGSIAGAEALLRCDHPGAGPVAPPDLLHLADLQGVRGELDDWIVRTAIAERSAWPDGLFVAINASPHQLRDDRLVEVLAAACREHGVAPSDVWLELTEEARVDAVEAHGRIRRLRELGVRLALDDFGSGYASFASLRSGQFDVCKIDRSFVAGLGTRRHDDTLFRSVVEAAHALGATVVAEGIEYLDQWDRARWLGCDLGQGFLLHRPQPGTAFRLLLGSPALPGTDGASHPAPSAVQHRILLYADPLHLGEQTARALLPAFRGDGVAMTVTSEVHGREIRAALERYGVDVDLAEAEGRFVRLELETMVDQLGEDGVVAAAEVSAVFRGVLEQIPAGRPIHAFSEVAPSRWAVGDITGVHVIESIADELCRDRPGLHLLCGYPVLGFTDRADVASLASICARHHHLASGEHAGADQLSMVFELLRHQVIEAAELTTALGVRDRPSPV